MKLTEQTKGQDAMNTILKKSWEDPIFKEELMKNPVQAIEKTLGIKLNIPEGKTLKIIDQTDQNAIYFNIPNTQEIDGELNEEELEKVAGGCQWGDSGILDPIPFPKFPDIFDIIKEA